MTPRHALRRWAGAAALTLGLLATGLAQPTPAIAAPVDAPVTQDDRVTMYAGGEASVDLLANDSDPQGADLAVCRIGPESYRNLDVLTFSDGRSTNVSVITSPRMPSGTYELTYYACNYERLTPGTLTVTVKRPKAVQASRVVDRPGRVRFKNPNERRVVVLWGSRSEERPDGRISIPAHEARIVQVQRTQVFWIAFLPTVGAVAGSGIVRGIELPRTRLAPTRTALAPRYQRLWTAGS